MALLAAVQSRVVYRIQYQGPAMPSTAFSTDISLFLESFWIFPV